jgi:SAM-dependent methyltransferase
MSGPVFDFGEVFDEDYLHFYEPRLGAASEGEVETIWRVLELEPGMAVLDLACGHGRIANRLAERGRSRSACSSRPSCGTGCSAPGFAAVDFYDGQGGRLTAEARRMITVARR